MPPRIRLRLRSSNTGIEGRANSGNASSTVKPRHLVVRLALLMSFAERLEARHAAPCIGEFPPCFAPTNDTTHTHTHTHTHPAPGCAGQAVQPAQNGFCPRAALSGLTHAVLSIGKLSAGQARY